MHIIITNILEFTIKQSHLTMYKTHKSHTVLCTISTLYYFQINTPKLVSSFPSEKFESSSIDDTYKYTSPTQLGELKTEWLFKYLTFVLDIGKLICKLQIDMRIIKMLPWDTIIFNISIACTIIQSDNYLLTKTRPNNCLLCRYM